MTVTDRSAPTCVFKTQVCFQVCNGGADNLSFEEQAQRESDFFASKPELSQTPCKLGLPELSKALLQIQEDMLHKHMPDFVRQVQFHVNHRQSLCG